MAGLRGLVLVVLAAGAAGAAPVPTVPRADDEVSPFVAKLLYHRSVQKELKLSAEQRITVIDGQTDLADEFGKKFAAEAKNPAGIDVEKLKQLQREYPAAEEKFLKHVTAKVLAPGQRTRLRQIGWQVRGPAALVDPRVVAALELTDAQKKIAAELLERLAEKTGRYREKLGNDDADNLKGELLEFRSTAAKEFAAALTADQRDTWKALLGPPATGFDPVALWLGVIDEETYLAR